MERNFLGVLALLLNEGITLYALVPNFMLVTNSTVHWLILTDSVPMQGNILLSLLSKGIISLLQADT